MFPKTTIVSFIIAFCFSVSTTYAQGWERTFTDDGFSTSGYAADVTPEGNLLIGAYRFDLNTGDGQSYYLLVDPEGNKITDFEDVTFVGFLPVMSDLMIANDGSFVALISDHSFAVNDYIEKRSSDFELIWKKEFNPYETIIRDLVETQDGGYAITIQMGTFLLNKLDANGNLLWEKEIPQLDNQVVSELIVAANGDLLLSGARNAKTFRINQDGDIIWEKNLGLSSGTDRPISIVESNNGDIYIAGKSSDITGISNIPFISKTNSNGELQWYSNFLDLPYEIAFGSYNLLESATNELMLGYTQEFANGESQFAMMKIDKNNGAIIWEKGYGMDTHFHALANLMHAPDDGFYMAGFSSPIGTNTIQIHAIRTNGEGDVVTNTTNLLTTKDYKLFPSPLSEISTLSFENIDVSKATFTLYDTVGKLKNCAYTVEDNTIIIEKGNLTSGAYFFTVQNSAGQITTGKLIVQ